MKNFIIAFLVFCSFSVFSQVEYSYSITNDTDSTFQFDVIEEVNATRSTINRTNLLDSVALQKRLFSEITNLYQQRAQLIVEADRKIREINVRKQALTSVGLESYQDSIISELDSFFVAEYKYVNSTGRTLNLYSQYREGLSTLLRVKETNAAFGAITPFSTANIRLTAIRPEFEDGDESVNIFTSDLRVYRGTDNVGVTHLLIRIR
jgi:hypothetical protein